METNLPEPTEGRASRLNATVAITVALLSTVMGVCKVKDDNIVQAMQQAQADKVDHWSFYQARNLREELARATSLQLKLQAAGRPSAERGDYDAAVARYETLATEQAQKKSELLQQAQQDQKTYDALNYRDDQFDLADAAISIAIAALAVASLTQMWWLYALALVPGGFGTFMGIAGLAGWQVHPQLLAGLLS
jgi:lipopolysaccharide export LptBFGC system permease protein LptF